MAKKLSPESADAPSLRLVRKFVTYLQDKDYDRTDELGTIVGSMTGAWYQLLVSGTDCIRISFQLVNVLFNTMPTAIDSVEHRVKLIFDLSVQRSRRARRA